MKTNENGFPVCVVQKEVIRDDCVHIDHSLRSLCTDREEKKKKNNIMLTHISFESGLRKLNIPSFSLTGFFIIIEMPCDINGLLKSMTLSRSDVIVMAPIAISASYSLINVVEHFIGICANESI